MRFFIMAALVVSAPVAAQTASAPVSPAPRLTQTGRPVPAEPMAHGPILPGGAVKPVSTTPGQVSRNAPINGVLTLFGNERCPTNANGEEIVVCVRRSAQEQYRVPKELRDFVVTPENESWAAKAQGTMDTGVGVSSIGSCSTVGAGGATGCFGQRVRDARAENRARAKDVPVLP